MSKGRPLVSIIVRTKDRPRLLKRALQSVAVQTYRPIEVILVNDGGCELNIEELKGILKDISLNYIRLERNTGRAHAANVGIKNASGHYIGFLDDDDEFYPEHVSILVNFLMQGDYYVAYTDSEIVKFDYEIEKGEFVEKERYVLFSEDFSFERLLLGNYIPLMCLLFDNKVLKYVKFDETFDLYEDWDLLIQIAERYPFYHIKKVTAKYNQDLSGEVKQITANSMYFRPSFIKLMQKHKNKITPDVMFHSWQAVTKERELRVITNNLKRSVGEKEKIIGERNGHIQRLETELKILRTSISEKNARIGELELDLENKNGHIQRLEAELKSLMNENLRVNNDLNAIRISLSWKMVMKWHSLIDKIMPIGTRRRRWYDLGLLSLQIISNEGLKAFLRAAKNKILPVKIKKEAFSIGRELHNIKDKTVDVIIPVYNAFDCTKRCIESVLSFTDDVPYRLIIIDDKSTDPRIMSYLEHLKRKNFSNVIILSNKSNMGFVKTVNKGMRFSNSDVVILNSDTVVSYKWLKKLVECAYSDEKIATVTPLSNNATICSIPNFCQYNDIPEGYSIQEFALLVERVSKDLGKRCIKIPVGIGFCLYIKRDVINEIGFYDEIFGRGYNEENDFCMRAREKGYYHVADLSTFVYHKGKASFMDDQSMLEEINSKLLLKRYPYYMELVQDFVQRNPLQEIQNSIKSRIRRQNARIIVGLDAQLLVRNKRTGTERYIYSLLENLLGVDSNNLYITYTSTNMIDSFYYRNSNFMRKYATDSKDILLDSESIDVFHRTFQCFSIYDLLCLLKAKSSVITLHDLILYHFPSYFNSPQKASEYKILMKLSAQLADRVIAISEHNKKDIIQNLGISETKIDVIYQGLDTNKFKKIYDEDRLKEFENKYHIKRDYILYLGTDFPHKNHKNLIAAYKKLIKEMDNIDLDLIIAGPSTSISRRKNIETLIHDIKDRVMLLDYVDDQDIVYLYNRAKLFVYPSLYEGFGIPILEAMACGVPVVASNATSIPEVAGDAALLVDSRNVDELCKGMYRVLNDKRLKDELIEKGLKRVKNFQWEKTARKTIDTYDKAYKNSKNIKEKLDNKTVQAIRELLSSIPESEKKLLRELLGDDYYGKEIF